MTVEWLFKGEIALSNRGWNLGVSWPGIEYSGVNCSDINDRYTNGRLF